MAFLQPLKSPSPIRKFLKARAISRANMRRASMSRASMRWSSGLCLGLLLSLISVAPVKAAERVTLTYGFAEISTTVDALRAYAETGMADRELESYLRYLNEDQRSQLRQALQTRSETGPVEISRFLYSAIGENILRSIGGIIQTQGRQDGGKGLRGALVLAAAEPDGLTLLNVLDKFPTDNVRIDAQQAFRTFGSFTGLIQDTERALLAITEQSKPPSALAAGEPALDVLSRLGPYAVTTQELSVVDESRNRTLPTDLYLPTDAPPAGIVVISHGLAGDRKGFQVIAEHLASYGYAVAALDHPGSNSERLYDLFRGTASEISDPSEFSDRPRDVSYLLDELTRLNEGNGALVGKLDPSRVGIIGHSFGGYTALALSGAKLDFDNLNANCASDDFIYTGANPSMLLQCTALLDPDQFGENLQDERIQAVIALNPVTSSLFGPEGFANISIPSLIVAGSSDPVAPALLEQIQPFTWLNGEAESAENEDAQNSEAVDETDENTENTGTVNKEEAATRPSHYLALIQGGSHLYDPIDIEGSDRVALASQLVNADTPLAYSYLKALTLGFMQAEIDKSPQYQAALEDAAIIQIGRPPLPLYIVNELTEAMLQPLPVEPIPTEEGLPEGESPPSEMLPDGAADPTSEETLQPVE